MKTIVYLIRHADKLKGLIDTYSADDNMQLKNEKQILSIKGEEQASNLAKLPDFANVNVIFSSHYSRAIATAKYLAEHLGLQLKVDARLGERIVGDVDFKTYRHFLDDQYHNFDLRAPKGESINEAKSRVTSVFNEIVDMHLGQEIAIFAHEIIFNCLLLNYCQEGYSLDDKLILNYNDKLSISTAWHMPDGYKLTLDNKEVINIEKLEIPFLSE